MTTPFAPPPDKSPDRITPPKSIEPDQATWKPPVGSSFESYVQKGTAPLTPGTSAGPSPPSPMDVSRTANFQTPTAPPSLDSLIAQSRAAQDGLGTVQQQLTTPNLRLKRSQLHLLRNKLVDAQSYSRSAAAKLGVETSPMQMPTGGGPIDRFLAYVNDGQNQFVAMQKKLDEMSQSGQQLNAGDMMLLQSKMSIAQQEIEYSSVLLSRVISSITTIMGIQL